MSAADFLDKISDPAKRDTIAAAFAMLEAPYVGGDARRELEVLRERVKQLRQEVMDLKWQLQNAELRVETEWRGKFNEARWRYETEIDALRARLRAALAEKPQAAPPQREPEPQRPAPPPQQPRRHNPKAVEPSPLLKNSIARLMATPVPQPPEPGSFLSPDEEQEVANG